MDAEELSVFLSGVTRYFKETTGTAAEVASPYLIEDARAIAGEFTGAIGITGRHRGTVYFTASRGLLTVLMGEVGENRFTKEFMLDLVGDVANTISGNARQYFGADFLISVPTLIYGADALHLPKGIKSYAMPVQWRSYVGYVIVVLESQS
ncbi:MAG: chemotaxis protein CheX [Xanthomonadales bacterium]|jgi:chemotaxis protein CheX|nr:chemotaxis protein CheX [Xanthomonadales bacterium]